MLSKTRTRNENRAGDGKETRTIRETFGGRSTPRGLLLQYNTHTRFDSIFRSGKMLRKQFDVTHAKTMNFDTREW